MAFTLLVDPKAAKELAKLPKTLSRRMFRKIQESKNEPLYYWIKLVDRQDYKLRVGDYRAIADISQKQKNNTRNKSRTPEIHLQKMKCACGAKARKIKTRLELYDGDVVIKDVDALYCPECDEELMIKQWKNE